MDEFCMNLLVQFNMQHLIHFFEEHKITQEALELIQVEHLKEIIPMVGPRLIFTKKYNNYLKAQKQLKDPNLDSNFIQPTPPPTPAKQPTPLMQISQPRTEFIEFPAVASSSSALSVVPIEDPPRKKRRFDECLDDLKSILLQSAFGQAILDQKVLTESHRKELVHIIGEHILNNSFRSSEQFFSDMADQIVLMFPTESKETYFKSQNREDKFKNLKGKIVDRYYNRRKTLKKLISSSSSALDEPGSDGNDITVDDFLSQYYIKQEIDGDY